MCHLLVLHTFQEGQGSRTAGGGRAGVGPAVTLSIGSYPSLCAGEIASTEASRPIAHPAPLLRGEGTNVSFAYRASCGCLAAIECSCSCLTTAVPTAVRQLRIGLFPSPPTLTSFIPFLPRNFNFGLKLWFDTWAKQQIKRQRNWGTLDGECGSPLGESLIFA